MASRKRKSIKNKTVEVDGIRFETIMSNRMLIVPVKRTSPEHYTSVQLGFSITNNTSNPYYFSFFQFIPEIITSDGQNINGGYQGDGVGLLTDYSGVPHRSEKGYNE